MTCARRSGLAGDISSQEPDHEDTKDAAWVHAYLHRVEGDLGNAGYWYGQAGKPVAAGPLAAEWDGISSALLGEGI